MSAADPSPPPEAYGQPISAERQAELQAILDAWNAPDADHGERRGPFDATGKSFEEAPRPRLTGADVGWLADQSGRDVLGYVPNLHLEGAALSAAHLEGAHLDGAHLEGAGLDGAHLEGAHLDGAYLEGADLNGAYLEGADLFAAHLERANLFAAALERANLGGAHLEGTHLPSTHLEAAHLGGAHMEGVDLNGAHLEGAHLDGAYLEGADLREANLKGTNLSGAHLERADVRSTDLAGCDLRDAHLEGTRFGGSYLGGKVYQPGDSELRRIRQIIATFPTTLAPADLRRSVLDAATALGGITLGNVTQGLVRVADVRWSAANLAVVDWAAVLPPTTLLGDEHAAWNWRPLPFTPPAGTSSRAEVHAARTKHAEQQAGERLETFRAAVRANRQLATALRDQGMNEEADQFAYRAQVLQRQVFWQQRKRGRALLAAVLDMLAGHGYRPGRSIVTYLLVLAVFTFLFLLASVGIITFGLPPTTYHQLPWYEALVLSVASFHGRGFFQPVQSPGDPIAILAAIEAVFGLFIEVSFIATFTQRFFGK
jgi:uncharacterized protein YjbI with pentapeptide repeats